jgi:cellulose synthase/poly-beta-1,6-N-acetylglucosamine synthase-like glycosyltransferase
VAIWQVNRGKSAPAQAGLLFSRLVIDLFYILVIVQIAVGIYSLWDGFQWLRLVRARLASHAGFYTPVAAVICPCKGNEAGLEENLAALVNFDYPNYEIYFALASSLDPALKAIEQVKAMSHHPVHIVIAGPAADCSEKVFNLRRAVESLPQNVDVFVFTDSDARLPRGWLKKLVAPLQDVRIGATTGYRWIIPSGAMGAGGFASALASAWNASVATQLGRAGENFCWGGGTAIRRQTFEDAHVLEAWSGAASDDFAMTQALESCRKPIVFCAECLAPTLHPWTGKSLLEFTNRQMLITRVYSWKRWVMGALAHWAYSLTLIYAVVVILIMMISGDTWIELALITLVIPLLAAMKGALRTVAVDELLPQWRGPLKKWNWVWMLLAPIVPFLFAWNFAASLVSKRMRWRGIRYELVSPTTTRILSR